MTDFKHPSYGLVQFSHRHGSPKLFGSALNQHLTQNYVTLSIRKATLIREEGNPDRHYGSISGDLIEVNMTAAQFAELLTTMNIGMGVPCTISRLNNQRVEDPPALPSEAENLREDFKISLEKHVKELQDETLPRIREIVAKKNLNKADQAEILAAFQRVVRQAVDNAPFALDLFQESTEKVVAAAKTEIDAFMRAAVVQAGLEALQGKGTETPQLKGKDD